MKPDFLAKPHPHMNTPTPSKNMKYKFSLTALALVIVMHAGTSLQAERQRGESHREALGNAKEVCREAQNRSEQK